MSIATETETVIKKILPYLARRGYDVEKDLDFETAVKTTNRYSKGYIDVLVTCGKEKPIFLIEAKRLAKKLSADDRDQAISYAESLGIHFVVVTNGAQVQCFNAANKKPICWNGKISERIPTKAQLPAVVRAFKANQEITNVPLENEAGLPFRPGLPLKQLNSLFARCHNVIRKIEKDEEHAFADFAKLLFLKLLEEKADTSDFKLPYSYHFHELAERSKHEADQVQGAVVSMIDQIRQRTNYGDVLDEPLYLRKPATFLYIVEELAGVSFYDSSLDSKGAAFEYYVRATLKGKKLGQYFTPRPLVEVMSAIVGRDKVMNAARSGTPIKVLDPACGTGGFLVFLMQQNLHTINELLKNGKITKPTHENLTRRIKEEVFFGSDANAGVACAAKMNMIIAGDGHTNIRCEDSLPAAAKNWNASNSDCDLILTNPPFGTSESESLSLDELAGFPVRSSKGQHLFLQKMVMCTKPGGEICTVIDEGVLNTETASDLRGWLFKKCKIKAVVRLPDETFKPNKINVRSSLLLLQRWEQDDDDMEADYPIAFCDLLSLGYEGSGESIRGFKFDKLLSEIETKWFKTSGKKNRSSQHWRVFTEKSQAIIKDVTFRLDLKYWDLEIRKRIAKLKVSKGKTIEGLNKIKTERGVSPPSEAYVDEVDGYALVIKAGSNITKFGELVEAGDYIEKNLYDEYVEKAKKNKSNENLVFKGDVLLASTGDGTLGKCCVYTSEKPAIADGHVTIIRVNQKAVDPKYLCDYLRCGFGHLQIERLYTGSTGLIELTPSDVDKIIIDLLSGIKKQRSASKKLRSSESSYLQMMNKAEQELESVRIKFTAGRFPMLG
jgi:type I restriction enzyme M protein